MMELLRLFIDVVLHLDRHFAELVVLVARVEAQHNNSSEHTWRSNSHRHLRQCLALCQLPQAGGVLGAGTEHRSGGKQQLLGISKRGNVYLRTLLIHGAQTLLRYADKKTDRLSRWACSLKARKGFNVAAVALANKPARIDWAMLRKNTDYDVNLLQHP